MKEIDKKIMSMAMPIALDNLLQMMGGIFIMAILGRIDILAVGAVGLAIRMTSIVWSVFRGVTTAATVFTAQAFGAGNKKLMISTAWQTIVSTLFFTLIIEALLIIFAPQILLIFHPSPDIHLLAVKYLRLIALGIPFISIMQVCGGLMQGVGNAKGPMLITLLLNALIIAISGTFVFFCGASTTTGLIGAAMATVIAQIAAFVAALSMIFGKHGTLHGMLKIDGKYAILKLDFKRIKEIYKVGLPASAESLLWQLSAIIITRVILSYGDASFAAHQLGLQAEAISYMPATGLGVAATSLIGQALGAGEENLAKTYFKKIMRLTLLVTLIPVGMFFLIPQQIMSLLTSNAEVIRLGAIYLFLMGLVQLPQNASGVMLGSMRGAGLTKQPMFIAMAGIWGLRVPLTLILSTFKGFSITVIWSVICVDMMFRFIVALTYFRKKNIFAMRLLEVNEIQPIVATNDYN